MKKQYWLSIIVGFMLLVHTPQFIHAQSGLHPLTKTVSKYMLNSEALSPIAISAGETALEYAVNKVLTRSQAALTATAFENMTMLELNVWLKTTGLEVATELQKQTVIAKRHIATPEITAPVLQKRFSAEAIKFPRQNRFEYELRDPNYFYAGKNMAHNYILQTAQFLPIINSLPRGENIWLVAGNATSACDLPNPLYLGYNTIVNSVTPSALEDDSDPHLIGYWKKRISALQAIELKEDLTPQDLEKMLKDISEDSQEGSMPALFIVRAKPDVMTEMLQFGAVPAYSISDFYLYSKIRHYQFTQPVEGTPAAWYKLWNNQEQGLYGTPVGLLPY